MTSASPPIGSNSPALQSGQGRDQDILDAVREVFAQKGFDGASMQSLAKAAGMSVGNFYRYFPSKTAMIHAMIRRDIARIEEHFAQIATAEDPLAVMRETFRERVTNHADQERDAPIWAEMNATAQRNPEIAALMREAEEEVIGYLLDAFAITSGKSIDWVREHHTSRAELMIMLVKISSMRGAQLDLVQSHELTSLILQQIDQLLDTIVGAQFKEQTE